MLGDRKPGIMTSLQVCSWHRQINKQQGLQRIGKKREREDPRHHGRELTLTKSFLIPGMHK